MACQESNITDMRRYALRLVKLRGLGALPSAWKLLLLSLFGDTVMLFHSPHSIYTICDRGA